MPTTIYLSSGDEFVTTASFANAQTVMEADADLVSVEVVRWRNVDADDFDSLADLDDLPTYTATPMILRRDSLIACERTEAHLARIIDRAREHQLQHA